MNKRIGDRRFFCVTEFVDAGKAPRDHLTGEGSKLRPAAADKSCGSEQGRLLCWAWISQFAEKDRLYRCLDRLLEHKQELFVHLRQCWQDLFDARFDILLYDLTSTYIEGEGETNPKAKRGYSRDERPDCLHVVIALVVTPDGFLLAYEVMDGSASDKTTLRGFVNKIEGLYGKARHAS